VRLEADDLVLRPLVAADAERWQAARARNAEWLRPWDATNPAGGSASSSYGAVVRRMRRLARSGLALPFVIEVDGRFSGQVTVNNVLRGSAQWASIGYWLDQSVAGRGIMPRAVAMVIDHCFGPVGLHRVEICVRPENTNSLRVVEKLGMHEVGYAPRFLHIDGDWRDHRVFAVTVEECSGSMLERLVRPHPSHE